MRISLLLPFTPIAKARPRVTRTGHCYTPQKTKTFEKEVKDWLLANHHNPSDWDMEGAMTVEVSFYFERPKKPKRHLPLGRPDIDNLQKSLFDALNGIIWKDDSQVYDCHSMKHYDTYPGIRLTVWNR